MTAFLVVTGVLALASGVALLVGPRLAGRDEPAAVYVLLSLALLLLLVAANR